VDPLECRDCDRLLGNLLPNSRGSIFWLLTSMGVHGRGSTKRINGEEVCRGGDKKGRLNQSEKKRKKKKKNRKKKKKKKHTGGAPGGTNSHPLTVCVKGNILDDGIGVNSPLQPVQKVEGLLCRVT